MIKESVSQDIQNDLKKRNPLKPLSFSELAQLKQIEYRFFKTEPQFLDLLTQYSRDRNKKNKQRQTP